MKFFEKILNNFAEQSIPEPIAEVGNKFLSDLEKSYKKFDKETDKRIKEVQKTTSTTKLMQDILIELIKINRRAEREKI